MNDKNFTIQQLLAIVVRERGSDLHLRVDQPPIIRVHGDIRRLDQPILHEDGDIQIMMKSLLGDSAFHNFENGNQTRFLHSFEGLGYFEVQLVRTNGKLAASIRVLPNRVLTLDDISAPENIRWAATNICNGLMLINGKLGSGWSTTMAALRHEILNTQECHVVSLSSGSFANQPSIKGMHSSILVGAGLDVNSFDEALRSAEKLDPDYIFIMDHLDNLSTNANRRVLDLARFGYCVVANVNADSTEVALRQITGLLDYRDRDFSQHQLASVLRISICQRLLRTPDGSGRAACHEILTVLPDIRPAIAHLDLDKINRVLASHSLSTSMKRSAKLMLEQGMIDAAEFDLV